MTSATARSRAPRPTFPRPRHSTARGVGYLEALILAAVVGIGSLVTFRAFGGSEKRKAVCDASLIVALAQGSDCDDIRPIPFGERSNGEKKDAAFTPTSKPNPRFSDPWEQPSPRKWDGRWGVTACSNLLRFYGVEKPPNGLEDTGVENIGPGMWASTLAKNLQDVAGKTFRAKTLDGSADALAALRGYLDEGKPVAVMYKQDVSVAHWVVVTNVDDGADGPVLTLQSSGDWYTVAWKAFQDRWKRADGGPYPHVVGDEPSQVMREATARRD